MPASRSLPRCEREADGDAMLSMGMLWTTYVVGAKMVERREDDSQNQSIVHLKFLR